MQKNVMIIFCLFFLLNFSMQEGAAQNKDAMGLSVEPGGLLIQKVPIGQLYDMDYWIKMRFKICNQSDKARRYTLKVDKPTKVGVKILKGYNEIPDPTWFWFEKNDVLVPANGVEEIKIFLRVPNEEKYCNQKWAVGIDVEGKPEGEERLVLAVSPVFYIETETRPDVKEPPAGFLGLIPGIVASENVNLGKNKNIARIKIYNNDHQSHLYKISSLIPSAAAGDRVIEPSPNFSWIPDKNWLKPNQNNLKIPPHEYQELTLDLDLPNKKELVNQRWEGILFVESEEGLTNFARVQITSIRQWRNK